MKKILYLLCGLFFFSLSNITFADDSFVINKIRVQGLHYISYQTFLKYVPVKEGQRFDASESTQVIDNLYKSGFFDDVSLYRDNSDLVIKLKERPVISSVNISGNKKITTKQIRDVLKQVGFFEGQIFDDSMLQGLKNSLYQQYYTLGYYNVDIKTTVEPQKTGGIVVNLIINEGPVAKIKSIQIFGNYHFKSKEILKNFSMSKTTLFSWFSDSDQYSKEKLDADLETLKSFYFDRGYLEFKVNSSQVSITPDKKHIYIDIYVTEGPVYHISGFELTGSLAGQETDLRKLITIKKGDIFSRQKVLMIENQMTALLGDLGYAYAKVDPQTALDKNNHTVRVNFSVNPGHLTYIRRIEFSGNTRTAEYVLRREMRQMEGGLFSGTNIAESSHRLQNLGYLKSVEPQLKPVPGSPDEADLVYNVTEDSSAAASFNVGYSQLDKFIIGASINERNFLGTGKGVGVQFNTSNYTRTYNFSYFDPYFTDNNVSFSLNAYAQYTNQREVESLSNYSMDDKGFSAMFGYPLSENSRLNFGYGYDNLIIHTYKDKFGNDESGKEILSFVKKYGNKFDVVKLMTSWNYSDLDRAIFPTKGFTQSLGAELGVPVFQDNLEYYKFNYNLNGYYPLYKKYFVLNASGFLGYGNGYGRFNQLPFIENYFAGGLGSVRGYLDNTLGPKDTTGNSLGGNLAAYGTVALIFPNPLGDSVRTSAFYDIGNVFSTVSDPFAVPPNKYRFQWNQFRSSVGVQLEWHSVIPLVFSLAAPVFEGNRLKNHTDQEESFQFIIGASI
jgi:outer membrane protein insertion porin family